MKQRVPTKILQRYYELWLSGCSASDIQKRLKLSKSKFDTYTPDFLAYCRHQVKFDTRARLTEGDMPDLVQLTTEREEQFLQLISSGLSYDKAALLMNVPLVTITDYWFQNEMFKRKVQVAVEAVNAQVTMALFKRAVGYEYDGGYRTRTNGVKVVEYKDKETGEKVYKEVPYHSETIVEKTNVVEPDVGAARFWLFNRNPEQFSIDGQRTDINNKGKILQWIQDNAKATENELEDYDWEQEEYDDKYLKESIDD